MKTKMLLVYSAAILLAGVYVSCSKDQDIDKVDQHNLDQQLRFVPVSDRIAMKANSLFKEVIIIVTWDEWGRKKKDCKGWGLCNADWFPQFDNAMQNPVKSNGSESILEFDPARQRYYFDILLAENPPAHIPVSELPLVVDEDIVLKLAQEIGNDLSIKQGDYNYDQTLSQFGGYRIYLD
jgi:hypothetical protein